MSEAMTHVERSPSASAPLPADLRSRIGWICHALRIAAVLWIGWEVLSILINWSNKARVLESYGFWFSADFTGVSDVRYASAPVAALLFTLVAVVPVVICIL